MQQIEEVTAEEYRRYIKELEDCCYNAHKEPRVDVDESSKQPVQGFAKEPVWPEYID